MARFFGFGDEVGGSAVLWAVAVWTVGLVEGARGGGGVEVYGGGSSLLEVLLGTSECECET